MRTILILALLTSLSGCTSISTTGSATSNWQSGSVKSIYIVFDDFIKKNNEVWHNSPNTAASAEGMTKQIGVQAAALWPRQFAAQGVQVETVTTGSQKQIPHFSIVLIDSPKTELDYDMLISLASVTPRLFGRYDVNFEITLRDRKNRTSELFWEGQLALHKGIGATNERELAEQIANELLAKMKKDGLIK